MGGGESGDTYRKKLEIASNEKIAQQNLDFQKEKLAYDQQLQQQIFQREDSAYQRTVRDLRSAGVSPLAMQGTNAAGAVVQTEAPQNGMHYDYTSGMTTDAEKLNALIGAVNGISSLMKTAQETKQLSISNDIAQQTVQDEVASRKAISVVQKYNALDSREKRYYNNFYGITDSMPVEQKLARIAYVESLSSDEQQKRKTGQALREFEDSAFDMTKMLQYGKFDEFNLRSVGTGLVRSVKDIVFPDSVFAPKYSENARQANQLKEYREQHPEDRFHGGKRVKK